jgi:hypothetical protein
MSPDRHELVHGAERKARPGSSLVVVIDTVDRLDARPGLDLLGNIGREISNFETLEARRSVGFDRVKLAGRHRRRDVGRIANRIAFVTKADPHGNHSLRPQERRATASRRPKEAQRAILRRMSCRLGRTSFQQAAKSDLHAWQSVALSASAWTRRADDNGNHGRAKIRAYPLSMLPA